MSGALQYSNHIFDSLISYLHLYKTIDNFYKSIDLMRFGKLKVSQKNHWFYKPRGTEQYVIISPLTILNGC